MTDAVAPLRLPNLAWLAAVRRLKALHYSVVVISAAAILFLYYAYRASLPAPPGHYLGWFWEVFYFEFKNNVLGILMLGPILYATLTLGWKHSAAIVVALVIAVAPYVAGFAYETLTLFESLSLLIVPPALIISIELFLISNIRERRARIEKKRERAEVMRQLFAIQEDERLRISRELHDAVAQTLLVDASTAHNILEGKGPGSKGVKEALQAIKQNSLAMVAEIRCICQDLRPSILDNLGLVSSIKWLADSLNEQTGLEVDLDLSGSAYELNPDESVAVFRMVQEALNNVKKHASASHVDVSVAFEPTGLTIIVKDNGRGFETEIDPNRFAVGGKLGVMGMHERAQSIGADLHIDSAEDRGTKVVIRIDRTRSL